MERKQSPLRAGRQLTPELFDFYVARARAERAKAIAGLGGQVAAWLSGMVARLTRPRRTARPRDITGAPTVR